MPHARTIILVLATFVLCGCSAISELHYLEVDTPNKGWHKITHTSFGSTWNEFQFSDDGVTITTESQIRIVWDHRMTSTAGNWSWMGPMLLPIIPLWLDPNYQEKSAKRGNLQLEVSLTGRDSSMTVRLCDTKVVLFSADSSEPLIRYASKVGPREQNDVIRLSSKKQYFEIEFNLPYLKILESIDSVAFDFPRVQDVAGEKDIPRLHFKKGHRTTYYPFLFGG